MRNLISSLLLPALLVAFPFWQTPATAQQSSSGPPLPRFASLRANVVNLRTGPGKRYPVEWVFKRQGLPVEVIAEFETWRKVRDWEGTVGWVHQRMLSGRRYAVVIDAVQTMRGAPDDTAAAVALVEQGVVTEVTRCREGQSWCRVEAAGYEGWLKRRELWGVNPKEAIK